VNVRTALCKWSITGRAVKHRLLEIGRAAKCLTQANQERMQESYQKLLGLTRSVVRQASAVVQRWTKGRLKVVGKLLRVETQIGQLRHFLPLVEKVITQTKKRVLGGDSHVEDKVLSLFEPHTEVIRKGKAHTPNEFGRLVRIDEVENGIVSGYAIRKIARLGCRPSSYIRRASGKRRRWRAATADLFPPKTSRRRKPWE
jgi:IS5 family transposase